MPNFDNENTYAKEAVVTLTEGLCIRLEQNNKVLATRLSQLDTKIFRLTGDNIGTENFSHNVPAAPTPGTESQQPTLMALRDEIEKQSALIKTLEELLQRLEKV